MKSTQATKDEIVKLQKASAEQSRLASEAEKRHGNL